MVIFKKIIRMKTNYEIITRTRKRSTVFECCEKTVNVITKFKFNNKSGFELNKVII